VSRASEVDVTAAAALVLERSAILSRCTEIPGEIRRTFLSPAMDEAHAHLREWMKHAGLTVQLDCAGNILASSQAAADAPRLLIGSHLDTIPNAGAYDGVLGVLLALALAEARRGHDQNFALDVVGFSEEEGIRFSAPFLGSKAMTGTLETELLERRDKAGLTLQQSLDQFQAVHPEAIAPHLAPNTRAYLEFHIEQGPVLEALSLPLSVVTAIAGQTRGSMTFTGKAGHAGTTPMAQRHDALTAAAEWIGKVEQLALATQDLVATVGQITVEPGAVNVIPALASCSLDLRHADDRVREQALSRILQAAEAIAANRRLKSSWSLNHAQSAVPMNPQMISIAERAVANTGYPVHLMTSGAGHDAMVLASHLPSGMIFLRSPGGLSHHPDEAVMMEDVAAAIVAGLNFLDEFERAVCAGEITASA
jgi:allantoate deiminase